MKKIQFLSAIVFMTLIASVAATAQKVVTKNGITLTPVTDSPLFPKATLIVKTPAVGENPAAIKDDTARVSFSYALKDYKLTEQTADAEHKHCSNSKQGQHIHVILNNAPYLAKYDTNFTVALKEGNYVALSFLSRSYHESLKHKSAFDLRQFTVGTPPAADKVDLTKPLLFYSRPKAEYVGEDVKKVLLDFYLVNVTLSPKGYKVKATINGTEFTLTKWEALAMEGLPMGENTIQLELLDKDNKTVANPFNPVTRKITLKP